MKGYIKVKRLNKTGNYKSELDWDLAFKDKDNDNGWFKMVIQPIMNSDGNYEIKYLKDKDGYFVSGEAYIITGSEKEINNRIRYNYSDKWDNLIQTEVNYEDELW